MWEAISRNTSSGPRSWAGAFLLPLDKFQFGGESVFAQLGDDVVIEQTHLARLEILQLRLDGGPKPVSAIG
jgi:hypothetical protein